MITPQQTQELLAQYQRNLANLELQQAKFGGFVTAPLHIINQISDTNNEIQRLQHPLGGTPGSDHTVDGVMARNTPIIQVVAAINPALNDLIRQVRLRGVRVVQPQTERHLREHLAQATAALLYVTSKTIHDLKTQIEPYITFLRSKSSALVFVVGEQLLKRQSDELFPAQYRDQIIWFIPNDPPATLANIILEETVRPALQTLRQGQMVDIDLFSYEQAEYRYPGLLCLDARTFGKHPADWEQIWQALLDVRRVLNSCQHKTLAVRPMNSRLSLAVAFGAVFATTSGFHLHVAYEQRSRVPNALDTVEWWTHHDAGDQPDLLHQTTIAAESASTSPDWALWLNVSRRIDVAAQAYFATTNRQPAPIIRFETPTIGLTAVQTGDEGRHASALAHHFGERLRVERDERPGTLAHWFYALPVSLAVLIGQQVNACGPLQCYEFLNDESRYIPSCLIRSTQT